MACLLSRFKFVSILFAVVDLAQMADNEMDMFAKSMAALQAQFREPADFPETEASGIQSKSTNLLTHVKRWC